MMDWRSTRQVKEADQRAADAERFRAPPPALRMPGREQLTCVDAHKGKPCDTLRDSIALVPLADPEAEWPARQVTR